MRNKLFSTIAIFSLFFVLVNEITFGQSDTTFIFSKPGRMEVKMVVDGFYYVDTEDFDYDGTWQMDNQFVHLTRNMH